MSGVSKSGSTGTQAIFGREPELEFLESLVNESRVQVAFVNGIPGAGTSTLLRTFASIPRQGSGRVCYLDCRSIAPTQDEFLKALGQLGFELGASARQVLCLDHYDHFLLLDPWIRDQHSEIFGAHSCLVIAHQNIPTFAWRTGNFRIRSLQVDVLKEVNTLDWLQSEGISGPAAQELWRLTQGHPLALQLALSAEGAPTGVPRFEVRHSEIVHDIAVYFLQNVKDPFLRAAVEATSTVRRITPPILSAMLERPVTTPEFESLAAMPITEVRDDGLSLHRSVRQVIAEWLQSADPRRFSMYRRAAWGVLHQDSRNIGERDFWRYTADVIYLVDDPFVREAFFPSAAQPYTADHVRAEDHAAIIQIAGQYDGLKGADLCELWLAEAPQNVRVLKDSQQQVQGFYCLYDPTQVPPAMIEEDPIASAWQAHLPLALKGKPNRVLFLRRWLTANEGDLPSPGQAACWLDAKRTYLENRPLLQRVYAAVVHAEAYGEVIERLGYRIPPEFDQSEIVQGCLDLGVGSVDAWFAQLVRQSLGLQDLATLNRDGRSLELDGRSIALTPREYSLVESLLSKNGETMSRSQLLEKGWAGKDAAESNVVDVAIRGLRKKLGGRASLIKTVRGAGYRWNA